MEQANQGIQIINLLTAKSLNKIAWTEDEAIMYRSACRMLRTTFDYYEKILNSEIQDFDNGGLNCDKGEDS